MPKGASDMEIAKLLEAEDLDGPAFPDVHEVNSTSLGRPLFQSSDWQKLAAVPQDEFKTALASYAKQADDEQLLNNGQAHQGPRHLIALASSLKKYHLRGGQIKTLWRRS